MWDYLYNIIWGESIWKKYNNITYAVIGIYFFLTVFFIGDICLLGKGGEFANEVTEGEIQIYGYIFATIKAFITIANFSLQRNNKIIWETYVLIESLNDLLETFNNKIEKRKVLKKLILYHLKY